MKWHKNNNNTGGGVIALKTRKHHTPFSHCKTMGEG